MPAPLAKGLIIAASVLVAAGIAAYENPQFREWLERSREKITVAFQSMGEGGQNSEPRPNDRSMNEDQDEKAEERRRQARQDILERGRMLQDRSKRRKLSSNGSNINEKRSTSLDLLIDEDDTSSREVANDAGVSSALENSNTNGLVKSRNIGQEQSQSVMHDSVDAPMLLRHLDGPAASSVQPWESRYEQEMRNTWVIPLPERRAFATSTHASESLIDLTPTTEDFPDPDVSIPSLSDLQHPLDRTEYFSVPPSRMSHTMSESGTESEYYYAHPDRPLEPLEPRPYVEPNHTAMPDSSAASHVGRRDHHPADFGSEDDLSDFGDGVRTPASAWTEVGSTVSGDA